MRASATCVLTPCSAKLHHRGAACPAGFRAPSRITESAVTITSPDFASSGSGSGNSLTSHAHPRSPAISSIIFFNRPEFDTGASSRKHARITLRSTSVRPMISSAGPVSATRL